MEKRPRKVMGGVSIYMYILIYVCRYEQIYTCM